MALTQNNLAMIKAIAEGDMEKARTAAIASCAEDTSKKNAYATKIWSDHLLHHTQTLELPLNIRNMATLEDVSKFREDRYYLSDWEAKLIQQICEAYDVSLKLMELDVPYLNSTLLTGSSGTGKTMFGKYVAYKLHLPFLYINFSYLIDSLMGQTGKI